MKLENIFKLYGMKMENPDIFKIFQKMMDTYKVNIWLLKIVDEKRNHGAIEHPTLPGLSDQYEKTIMIGYDGKNYFWLPSKNLYLIEQNCSKPNCGYSCLQKKDMDEHEKVCTNQTKLTVKQVR